MIVKALTLLDSAEAARLHKMVFYRSWSEDAFSDFLHNPCVRGFKEEKEGHLRGYILWQEVAQEVDILTLVVAPEWQRQGVGSALFATFLKELKAKNVTHIFLEVAQDNNAAQAFYISQGFEMSGERPNYYPRKGNTTISALTFFKNIV